VAAVPPNHAPTYRSSPKFRPSPQPLKPPRSATSTTTSTLSPDLAMSDDVAPTRVTPAVTKLRQLLAPKPDYKQEETRVHEDKVEAAGGGYVPQGPHGPHLVPLAHVLPQITILLQLLVNLLHQVVPPQHIPPPIYHHSGAPLHPHVGYHGAHHAGQHYHGAYSHQGGLLNPKPLGPFYGPGLYGVSAGNNVLGKGPFPAYKYEDNAKKK
jgi:hypothetical protein